jgi:5-methylcytosine-specific restriction endonuclease McrA
MDMALGVLLLIIIIGALLPPASTSRRGHRTLPSAQPSRGAIPQDVKIAVAVRDDGKCRRCGSRQNLHYDHIIPRARGGTNKKENIQLLCQTCNLRKGVR